MNVFRINLQQSFDAYREDKIISCPLKGHPGYYGLADAVKGDLLIIATKGRSVGAFSVVEDSHIGNLNYFEKGGRLSMDKRIVVKTTPLCFCDIAQSDLSSIPTEVFTCPSFTYKLRNYDRKMLFETVNKLIAQKTT